MRERPILFSDAMVRAILAGTKTQTRRVIRADHIPALGRPPRGDLSPWPFEPGDRLWVREAWSTEGRPVEEVRVEHEDVMSGGASVYYRATEVYPASLRWRPSIHMPRWASRLTLEVTSVRVERVQSISEEDARAEGIECAGGFMSTSSCWMNYGSDGPSFTTARGSFMSLWDSINGKREGCSWADNPWVWVARAAMVTP